MLSFKSLFIFVLMAIVAICVRRWFYPKYSSITSKVEGQDFDVIIIGGGTAGCVLASRISENEKIRVLLVEAGGQDSLISRVPMLAPMQMLTDETWPFKVVKQKHSHFGYHDQSYYLSRGKFLGGSGHMNFHMFNISQPSLDVSKDELTQAMDESGILKPFLEVGKEMKEGKFFPTVSLIKNGKRNGVLDIFLRPALNRPNLSVLLETEVSTMDVLGNKGVSGLHMKRRGKTWIQSCQGNCKVILAGGSISTPLLLLQSGIGPKDLLQREKIPVVKDLPVGTNMIDNLLYPLYFNASNADLNSVNIFKALNPMNLFNYIIHKSGMWAESAIEGYALFPDQDAMVILYSIGAPEPMTYSKISNMRRDTFDALFPNHSSPSKQGFILLATCLNPFSRGSVSVKKLSKTNFLPLIDPNFLSDEKDIQCLTKAVQIAVNIGTHPNLKRKIGSSLHVPILKECAHIKTQGYSDNEFTKCAIQTASSTMHHPIGTTQMDLVTDRNFRVKGIENLYLADGGTISKLETEFPNLKIIQRAKKVADQVKKGFLS